jgi:hypothetical protein
MNKRKKKHLIEQAIEAGDIVVTIGEDREACLLAIDEGLMLLERVAVDPDQYAYLGSGKRKR